MVPHVRRARPEEGGLLTELTVRSKAYWGYDDSFLESAREALEFQASKFLPDFHVYILEAEVELRHIGKGYGKELWDYAVNLARSLGFSRLVLTADPHAEPFYARQGAVRIGEKASPVRSDRWLPVMEYVLSA